MNIETLFQEIAQKDMWLPFDLERVKEIEEEEGIVRVILKNGMSFRLQFIEDEIEKEYTH